MNSNLKNILILFLVGTVIFIIGSGLNHKYQYDSFNDFFIEFAFYQLYSFVLGFSNMSYFKFLETVKWKEGQMAQRIVIGIIGALVITMVGLFLIRMSIAVFYLGMSFGYFWQDEHINDYYFGIWVTLTALIVFHFIYFYNKYQKTKVKESQIVAKNQMAKFESLKNQLDPHFLFNSLNVLTSLIGENPLKAEKFTTRLSKVYRY